MSPDREAGPPAVGWAPPPAPVEWARPPAPRRGRRRPVRLALLAAVVAAIAVGAAWALWPRGPLDPSGSGDVPAWLVYPGATVVSQGHSSNLGITATARNITIGTDANYRDVAAYLKGQFTATPGWVPDGSSSMVGSVEEVGTCVWHDASVRVRVGFQEPSTWSKRLPRG